MKKSSLEIVKILNVHKLRVFTTRDVTTLVGITSAAATHALQRLEKQELVVRIKRGLWVNRLASDLNPFEAVPYLRSPWISYVSLHSALSEHGVIEEIPHVIYAVTSALPKNYKTPIGNFHIHHLPDHLMWGYEIKKVGQGSYCMAEPEKAFLDLAYLSLIPRSPVEMVHKRSRKWNLNFKKLNEYARRFKFPPLIDWLRTKYEV